MPHTKYRIASPHIYLKEVREERNQHLVSAYCMLSALPMLSLKGIN